MTSPLVSILIPCYNAEAWVGEAIQSALAQTYEPKEVIVVDDGSTDGSLEVIQSFGDRIRWETGPNRGANATRNRLLELSRGEWLQYLDADDYLLPRKLEVQMRIIEHQSTDIVVSPSRQEDGTVTHWADEEDPWSRLMKSTLGNTISNLWRKPAIVAAGGWNPSQPCCQEYELMFRMLRSGARVRYCRRQGAVARAVPGSIWRRNPSLGHRRHAQIVMEAVSHLQETDSLNQERIDAAAAALFARASVLMDGGENPDAVLAIAREGCALLQKGACLGADERRSAGIATFLLGQRLWDEQDLSWQRVEQWARRIHPALRRALLQRSLTHGLAYTLFGFRVSQRLVALSRRLRRRSARAATQSSRG